MSDQVRRADSGPTFSSLYKDLQPNSLAQESEQLYTLGRKIYSNEHLLRMAELLDNDRAERLRNGADYICEAIDREYGANVARLILPGVSRSVGHDLSQTVTRGDLVAIERALKRQQPAWQQIGDRAVQDTKERIARLSERGFREAAELEKQMKELRDPLYSASMVTSGWSNLLARLTKVERAGDRIVSDIELKLKILTESGKSPTSTTSSIQSRLDLEKLQWGVRRDVKSVEKLQRLRVEVDNELHDQVAIAKHNQENKRFGAASSAIIEIKTTFYKESKVSPAAKAVSAAIAEFDAINKQPLPKEGDSNLKPKLDRQRAETKQAAERLYSKYEAYLEAGFAKESADRYYALRAKDLLTENSRLVFKAMSQVGPTPATLKLQRDLSVAIEKVEEGLNVSSQQPSSAHVTKTESEKTVADLAEWSDDDLGDEQNMQEPDVTEGKRRLDTARRAMAIAHQLLQPQTGAVVGASQEGNGADQPLAAVARQIARIAELPAKGGDGSTRSEAAVELVLATDPNVLSRLRQEDTLSLLQSVLSNENMPKAGPKDEPVRVALRKLYSAMPLDAAFVAADNRLREDTVTTLLESHGRELAVYRQNWAFLTDAQRMHAIDLVLTAHLFDPRGAQTERRVGRPNGHGRAF